MATLSTNPGGVSKLWAGTRPTPGVGLAWIGQSGFAFRFGRRRALIDPYLSDFLAQKYRGADFPHERLMPPPIDAQELRRLEWVLCTHAHSDHMDPITLSLIATVMPDCRFVVPAAERTTAESRGIRSEQILAVDAGETHDLGEGLVLRVIPAAHEDLRRDSRGRHHFLGYVLSHDRVTVYHSGDCVPFDGLQRAVSESTPDLALLPVNGRDEYRRSRGVPGNFTILEAERLACAVDAAFLIPHHFGMFDFNTVDQYDVAALAQRHREAPLRVEVPDVDHHYFLREA